MSLALYMAPVIPPPPGEYLGGHPLKGLLCDAFGEHDGSLVEEFLIGPPQLDTLRTLLRMETRRRPAPFPDLVEGLSQVIGAVEKHGVIRLWTAE